MKQRLITAGIGLLVLVPVLIFSDTLVLTIADAFFATMGVWEMLGCIGVRKKLSVLIPSLIVAASIPLFTRYLLENFGGYSSTILIYGMIFFIYMFCMMCVAVTSKGTFQIGDMAITVLSTLYITIGFSSIIMLHDINNGRYLFYLIFMGAWVTDGSAYFVGRALGKHKLIPDVSPKKTVEGAVGGLLICAIVFMAYGLIVGIVKSISVNGFGIFIVGILISAISQSGDLIASLIKRHYGIKDYGKLFPGHGGVMDRFDSIIAIAPFLLMFSSLPDFFTIFG